MQSTFSQDLFYTVGFNPYSKLWEGMSYSLNLFIVGGTMAEEDYTKFKQRSSDSYTGNPVLKVLLPTSDLTAWLTGKGYKAASRFKS